MSFTKLTNSHTTLYDRVKKLLVSDEWSDCCFNISEKCFKAHKLILGTSSPVFEAMFYGPWSSNNDIVVTDIEPDIFHDLLTFIYTDSINISSIEQAYELLYASRKYMLDYLSNICITYIQTNMSIDNVMTILHYPDYMQEKNIFSNALKLFCEHANYLLKEYITSISVTCMKTILKSQEMNIAEKDLIKHVFRWTVIYCEQNNIPVNFDNRRGILIKDNLMELLRWHSLTNEDLNEVLNDKFNLLLLKESDDIVKHKQRIKVENLMNVQSTSRNPIEIQWSICRRSPLRSVTPITIGFNQSAVQSKIRTNRSLLLKALSIPTRLAPVFNFSANPAKVYCETLFVSIEIDNVEVVKHTSVMNEVSYNSVVDITLPEPCFIEKEKWYKIIFQWPHTRSHDYTYVVEYREREHVDQKTTIRFDDCCSESVNTVGSFLIGMKFYV